MKLDLTISDIINNKEDMLIFIKKLDRRISSNKSYKITYALFFCETCECYVEKPISYKGLISCGCVSIGKYKDRKKKHGDSQKGKIARLYRIWHGIKDRCLNINNKDYGGRGITVCPEWTNDYIKFRDWALNNGYADNLIIDRKDPDGNYEPTNCRWLTVLESNRNKTNTITMEIRALDKTEKYTQKGLSEKFNVTQANISYILNNKTWEDSNG